MPKPKEANSGAKPGTQPVTKNDYLSLAGFLQGGESAQRVYKKDPNGAAVPSTAGCYKKREYVLPTNASSRLTNASSATCSAFWLAISNSKPISWRKSNTCRLRPPRN